MKHCAKKIWKKRPLMAILLLLLYGAAFAVQAPPSREYQLKALFLFNFTHFVDWPPSSFESDNSPLVICILGENPFSTYLEQTVSGEKINGHPVVVHYCKGEADLQTCHILFINLAEITKQKAAIATLKGKAVLTVSDASGFMEEGGMIRFLNRNNKIKLQINLDASKTSELVLSSKLLGLAEIFKPSES